MPPSLRSSVPHANIGRFERAAGLLNNHLPDRLVGALLNGFDNQIHLAVLASERYDNRCVNIRICGIPCHHIHGILLVGGNLRTAKLVVKSDRAFHLLGDNAGGIRSTDTGGQDQYLIAHAHTAIRPLISIKSHVCPPILFLPGFPGGLPHCVHGHAHRHGCRRPRRRYVPHT